MLVCRRLAALHTVVPPPNVVVVAVGVAAAVEALLSA